MPTTTTAHSLDDEGLAVLRRPRADLLIEREVSPDTWECDEGPFRSYRRSLTIADVQAGRHQVTERIDFTLAVPLWRPLINPLMKRDLRSTRREPRPRWWWPSQIVAARTATLVSVLCVFGLITGYLGVIIGQTITFAARDFGNGDSAQANTLAAVRVGVLISLVVLPRADRIGRRPLILGFATAAIIFTTLGALAPSLAALGATQTIARGLTTGLITLLVLAATEEVPSGTRAFTISLLTVCTALGAGMVLWVLPVADVFDGGWRIVYVVPTAFLFLVWHFGRKLPETRRFHAATDNAAPADINWRRFALLGSTAFMAALFLSPASQLRNEFLRDDLGYSATSVSLFQLVISAPAGAAIMVAGVMADRFGRRWIAAFGIAVGATMMATSYQLGGIMLWVTASAGVVLSGAAFPATRGYATELFPTRARAKVGGLLDTVGVAGSATGLIVVGRLSERWDDLGSAIGVMVFAPIIVAVIILTRFPETAATELEAFNPADPVIEPVENRASPGGSPPRGPRATR